MRYQDSPLDTLKLHAANMRHPIAYRKICGEPITALEAVFLYGCNTLFHYIEPRPKGLPPRIKKLVETILRKRSRRV